MLSLSVFKSHNKDLHEHVINLGIRWILERSATIRRVLDLKSLNNTVLLQLSF